MGSATVQGQLWSTNAGQWAERQEHTVVPMYRGALDDLGDVSGLKLCDAGCGSGLFLKLAAERGATVSGLDAAPGQLEVARERAPGADLRVGDIEAIPFGDRTFDIVTAFNAVQYADDPVAALGELRRLATNDGRVLVGQWTDPSRCETAPLFAALRSAAPPPPGTPARISLEAAGQLEMKMEAAGLRPVHWAEAVCPFD